MGCFPPKACLKAEPEEADPDFGPILNLARKGKLVWKCPPRFFGRSARSTMSIVDRLQSQAIGLAFAHVHSNDPTHCLDE